MIWTIAAGGERDVCIFSFAGMFLSIVFLFVYTEDAFTGLMVAELHERQSIAEHR